jgi:acetolactate synthase-1/2/3 large subunit
VVIVEKVVAGPACRNLPGMSEQGHGGRAVSLALKALGVENIFTLSGGHIFPIFDGCKQDDIRIVDTRHEQNAGFAAEGWGRLTRSLGVAVVTAGPGVTNIVSPLAMARFNGAPVLALAGRAPSFRWGQGSLQELDHPPFIDPLAPAATVGSTDEVAGAVLDAARRALTPPMGPRFLDFPLDVLFNMGPLDVPEVEEPTQTLTKEQATQVEELARLISEAERPIVMAGSGVWLERGEEALRRLAEVTGVAVYMNGQGRGCLPADHPNAFARSRSKAMREADLVIVAGTPLDFRLGFGQNFASDAKLVHIYSGAPAEHVKAAIRIGAPCGAALQGVVDAFEGKPQTDDWLGALAQEEERKSQGAGAELTSDASPIHPMRVYGELVPLLQRDAIVIGDGGDFVSYAGKEVASYEPGCWLDPGPFGCLGVGPGYALAARLAYPDRQVVVLYGDGALGFSAGELETLCRHRLPVVCVVGNNGIWGLEKHPMQAIYGYDVAADLRPGIRYDQMMEAFGGKGELVTEPNEIAPAIKRAFDSGEPYLVNVLTDPAVAYPRSANLA